MIRALLALMLLTACTDPSLGVGMRIGPGGVSVSPSVSAGVGGGYVTYTP